MKTPEYVLIVAPQGSGKSSLAEELRKAFGCTHIVDEWDGLAAVERGALILTDTIPPAPPALTGGFLNGQIHRRNGYGPPFRMPPPSPASLKTTAQSGPAYISVSCGSVPGSELISEFEQCVGIDVAAGPPAPVGESDRSYFGLYASDAGKAIEALQILFRSGFPFGKGDVP